MKQTGLGKGLGALMGSLTMEDTAPAPHVPEIDVNLIDVCKDQPRKYFDDEKLKELADSIKLHGVIQPLVLQKKGDRYSIIAGERRYRASRLAGLKQVPAIVKEMDDKTRMELSLIENIQREDLNPIEEAEAIQLLMDEHHMTHEEVAGRIGRSRSAVTNSLRLLSLTPDIKEQVITGQLSAGHARALLGLKTKSLMEEGARQVTVKALSVRQTEQLVKDLLAPPKPKAPKAGGNDEYLRAGRELSQLLETKVQITGTDKKGKIIIDFYSREQLEGFFDALAAIGGKGK